MRKVQEVIIIAVVMAFAFAINHAYLHSIEAPLENRYQAQLSHLYPAIFWAADYGLGTTDVEEIPGLPEFIFGKTESFDISAIPPDIQLAPLTSPALSHLYLLYAVGLTWRLFGVSLEALVMLLVFLRTINILVIYALFRTVFCRGISLAAALFLCLTPALLFEGLMLRYFFQSPFLFSTFLVCLALTVRQWKPSSVLAFSALTGGMLGIGMGFRQDLLICLPPSLAGLLCFARVKLPYTLRRRATALFLFTLLFILFASPVLLRKETTGGETPLHAVLLGLSPRVESDLGFGGASYEVMPAAVIGDSANLAVISTYARRAGTTESMLNKDSGEYKRYEGDKDTNLLLDPYYLFNGRVYAQYAERYVRDLLWTFPADFITRAWEAVASVPRIPADMHELLCRTHDGLPRWIRVNLWFQEIILTHIKNWGLLYMVLALCAYSGRHFSSALFLTGVLAWFGGSSSLMYAYRYIHYLAVLPVLASLVFFYVIVKFLMRAVRAGDSRRLPGKTRLKADAINILCFLGVLLFVFVVPIAVLRFWQARQVNFLVDTIEASAMTPIQMAAKIREHSMLFCPETPLPGLVGSGTLEPGNAAGEYVALAFDTHGRDIPVTIEYDKKRSMNDYSQTIVVQGIDDGDVGRVYLYFPVYELDTSYKLDLWRDFKRAYPYWSGPQDDMRPLEEQDWWKQGRFEGISISGEHAALFSGFFTVDIDDAVRILPTIQIPRDRGFLRTYKTGDVERTVRSWMDGCRKRPISIDPVQTNNDCWELDEDLLFPPALPIFASPLLKEDTLKDYLAQWQQRLAYITALSDAAARDLANKGTEWFRENRIEDAIGAYTAACEFAPDDPLYFVRIGQLFQNSGRNKESLEAYRRAILLRPDLLDTAHRLNKLSAETEDPAMLRDFWLQVLEKYPDNRHAGMQAGILLDYFKDHARAAEIYNHIHKSYPDDFHVIRSLIRNLFGAGKYTEAHSLVEQSVSRFPDRIEDIADMLIASGYELSQLQKDNAEAETVYLLALKLIPDDPHLWIQYAQFQISNSNAKEARQAYLKALKFTDKADISERHYITEELERIIEVP